MVCMPSVCDNSLLVKLIMNEANKKLRFVYSFTHGPVLDLERQHSEKQLRYYYFRLFPPILDIRQTIMSPAVGRGLVHVARFVTHLAFGTTFLSAIIAKL